ncbi:MAG: acyl-ACP--UDP-N-acetylglucosamine O-acyltransferase [bacterium]
MIHPTAIIAPQAKLAPDVSVGPYTVIGPDVEIGAGAILGPHAVVDGHTKLGAKVQVFQFASVGAPPQDLKYAGEPTRVEIGDGTILRESVTIHRGTATGGGLTRIGAQCLVMAYAHVAHDCVLGDRVILANGVQLAGHVEIESHAILGGLSAVHQFARIGTSAMLGGGTMASKDVVPFVHCSGNRDVQLHGINSLGLRRRGFSDERIRSLKAAYRILFRSGHRLSKAMQEVEANVEPTEDVQHLLRFIRESERGIHV